jgi:REP element-mobilizing transposase RayT
MPRTPRIVIPNAPHHITHRGNNHNKTFIDPNDYLTYLFLLKRFSTAHSLKILGYCLMPNHVHLVAIPERRDSMAKSIHAAHMRYTQLFNKRYDCRGHLWQGRYYSCPMDETHLIASMIYLENNPVRAGLSDQAWDYQWSSAVVHSCGLDPINLVEIEWWSGKFNNGDWCEMLKKGTGPKYDSPPFFSTPRPEPRSILDFDLNSKKKKGTGPRDLSPL